jgi:hypothetical protein
LINSSVCTQAFNSLIRQLLIEDFITRWGSRGEGFTL